MTKEEEIIAVLQLINTPKVGAKTFYQLIGDYGSVQAALASIAKNGKNKPWSEERAKQEIATAEKLGVEILLYTDKDYPMMLKTLDDAPPILYLKGNRKTLNYRKSLAIVGSRAASINGRKTAAKTAKDLTESGVCIVSGMARGIDAAAHKGALYANGETGTTIAVLGTGLDVIYPPENEDLFYQIAERGCIISEVAFGTPATAAQFPRRNRIVAALSEAILVVEAGLKSGSLITASLAQKQHKMLFAVPGTPGESRTQGSNFLIKNGAVLVESAEDILPFLKGNKTAPKVQNRIPKQKVLVFENNDVNLSEPKEKENLVDYITIDGVYIDELIRLSGKDAAAIAMEILELEMGGIVERRAGNKVALIKAN